MYDTILEYMREKCSKFKKRCEQCNKVYLPIKYQYDRQKYCSHKCKEKQRTLILKQSGVYKGGYSRETHIRLWVDAMGIADTAAFCHYCNETLYPDKFVIEHKIPRIKLKSRAKVTDITNLVVSCPECNKEKASMDYNKFLKRKNG